MATSDIKKLYCRELYSHLEKDIILKHVQKYDKHGMPTYEMRCPICLESRGFLRMQAAFLLCKKCGQKGKKGKKGPKHTQQSKEKISRANWLRNLRKRGVFGKLSNEEKKIVHNCRTRIWQALKGKTKSASTIELIGCSISELKAHLESKFQPGMNWDNYSLHGWHIDHIVPLNSFNLSNPEELKKACHFTNLQPLWAKDNLKKGDTYAER